MKEEIVEKLLEYVKKTENFALEQLPDVFSQMLKYEKISAWIGIFISIFFIILFISISIYFYKHPNLDSYGCRKVENSMGIWMPLFFSPVFICIFIFAISALIKITIAPKYFLIELIRKIAN